MCILLHPTPHMSQLVEKGYWRDLGHFLVFIMMTGTRLDIIHKLFGSVTPLDR